MGAKLSKSFASHAVALGLCSSRILFIFSSFFFLAGSIDIASTNKTLAQDLATQNFATQNIATQDLAAQNLAAQEPKRQEMPVRELGVAEAVSQFDRCFKEASEALRNGRYGDAERLYRRAIILAGRFGESDKRYGKAFGNLGRLLVIRARFDEAEPLLEEELHSIECREHLVAAQDSAQLSKQSAASNGAASGGSAITENNPASDIDASEKPRAGAKPSTGAESVVQTDYKELIPAMSSLASFYLNYGTESKAEPLTGELISLIDGRLGEYREATSGKITLKNGQPLTGWAGSAASTMTNPVVEWAIALDSVAGDLRSKGKLDMAERCYNVALEVKETVLGKEHLSLANSFDSLAAISQERGDLKQAEQYFSYALETTERILPKSNPQVYSRLDRLAKCFLKENKLAEAEALYLKAQSFWEEPSRNGSEARAAYALGNVYMLEKKYQEAQPYLASALKLAEEFYGPDSIALVPFLNRYADLMYYQGQDGPRQELKARACAISGTPL